MPKPTRSSDGPANAFDSLHQCQVQYVALCVTATESVCQRREARQQRRRKLVVAAAKGDQRAAGGQTELPCGLAVARPL